MKTLKITLIVAIITLTNFNAKAQNSQDQIQYVIELANEEYKDIIRFNSNFSEAETAAFWPILNSYLKDRDEAFTKEVNLYMTDYSKLTNKEAKEFIKQTLKAEAKKERIKEKSFNKISKKIPAKKFFRFLQIDNFIEAARNYNISSLMPLIKE